ncbi:MAG: hypothetical protein ACK4TA_07860 [Saprospiraceae bacterium]
MKKNVNNLLLISGEFIALLATIWWYNKEGSYESFAALVAASAFFLATLLGLVISSVTKNRNPMETRDFEKLLRRLTEIQFGRFLSAIARDNGNRDVHSNVAENVPIDAKVNQLLHWAESPNGPGLDKLKEIYQQEFGGNF